MQQDSSESLVDGILQNIDGISHIALTEEDVVRHKLVKAIIKAYDKEHEREEETYGKR